MLFVNESNNSIFLSHLKPVFDMFALLWLWWQNHHEFCIFCCKFYPLLVV